MGRDCTRLDRMGCLRSFGDVRGQGAGAQGPLHPAVGGDLARHHVRWARWPARQPHAQPGRGAVRHRGLAQPRSAPAGAPARALRSGPAHQRVRLALAGPQPPARARAPGPTSRPRPARRPRTAADQTDQGLTGAPGRREAPAVRDETAATCPGRGRPSRRPGRRRAAQSTKPKGARARPRAWSSNPISSGSSSARGPRRAVSAA